MTEENALPRAEQFLLGAKMDFQADRKDVAYSNARTACELAVKYILWRETGDWYKTHRVGSPLYEMGLMPGGIDSKELNRFLDQHRRGEYEFDQPVDEDEVEAAIELAEAVIDAALTAK